MFDEEEGIEGRGVGKRGSCFGFWFCFLEVTRKIIRSKRVSPYFFMLMLQMTGKVLGDDVGAEKRRGSENGQEA